MSDSANGNGEQVRQSTTGFPVDLSPSAIDRQLAAMWKQRGGEDEPGGVTRITLGNVIWFGSSRHVERIRRIFSQLVSRFPCRLFLLEYTGESGDEKIESFVNAYCFVSQGHENEVCCEEIHLRFGGRDSLKHINGAIRPLLVSDVPTGLWFFSSDPAHFGDALPKLIAQADKVITEISYIDDPAEALRAHTEDAAKPTSLSWYRMHQIRDQVAALFDEPRTMKLLPEIEKLRVGWAGDPADPQARIDAALLVGWMASRLGWTEKDSSSWPFVYQADGRGITVEFFTTDAVEGEEEENVLVHFEALCRTGDCLSLLMTDVHGAMERTVSGPCGTCHEVPRLVRVHAWSEAQALGFALSTPYHHGLYQEAAEHAWPILKAARQWKGNT